jgi:hypothetical protein
MHIRSSIIALALLAAPLSAQNRITSPLQEFGHNIGDDYFLANYDQLTKYWQKLDRESDRMKVVRIGTSSDGRPMWMAIITSPENHARLAHYQDISARLAHAEGLTDAQAHALAKEGKAVVWIDGGLHASEVLGAQQLVEWVYEMVSRNDAETQRFLRDVILLAVPANPDGMDLVSNWYMRQSDQTKRSTTGLPVLYHKYIGHDNNRDSYMASQLETRAMDSVMFRAWYPQIMYNHHQTGPDGTIIFAPPFRDPFNYNLDPLIPVGIDLVGAAIHNRFVAEGKPGSTMRGGSNYSTWWNGGLRTTVYFHNMIGLLTEAIGNPTPMKVEFVPERLLPSGNTPYPILPQTWHFAQSMAYELSANRAVMDIASKYREDFLYNIYKMGRNSIERGNTDTWTLSPKRVNAIKLAVQRDSAANVNGGSRREAGEKTRENAATYISMLHARELRDPRGYIISADQRDFPTAVKFVNTLVKTGITIHRATRPFSVGGKQYPAGSYVVKTAQAFRPHVLDMFEPQDHPDDIPYPGGPPTPPYDIAGWTLAYQMGIDFDRVLDPFDGPFEQLVGFAPVPAAAPPIEAAWYSLRRTNDGFAAVNRLLAKGEQVYTSVREVKIGQGTASPGMFFVRGTPSARQIIADVASTRGVGFLPLSATIDTAGLAPLHLPRIAIWNQYGGSIDTGWLQFIFEQFEFPYELVYPSTIDAGNLNAKYDVLILPDEAGDTTSRRQPEPSTIPVEYLPRLGKLTQAKSVPQMKAFVQNGGTLLTVGRGANFAYDLSAVFPVRNALVDSAGRPLPRSRFYIPGSVLSAALDTTNAIGWGMKPRVDLFFDSSPAFNVGLGRDARGIDGVATFDSATPLRSGWAWGQQALEGKSAIVVARLGKGNVVFYGPEVYFRSQSHGSFPLLFNGIYYGQEQQH